MNQTKLLTRKERAYIVEKISRVKCFTEDFGILDEKEEGDIITGIIRKIQAPQDFGDDFE